MRKREAFEAARKANVLLLIDAGGDGEKKRARWRCSFLANNFDPLSLFALPVLFLDTPTDPDRSD